jgi:primosomal protein N' (replication factor Y) (superfamily II helicase)
MPAKLARVLPISGFEKLLDYRVPPTIEKALRLGCLVRIPIRNRQELGVVMEFPKTGQLPPEKLKQITQLVMEHPALTEDSTELMYWMHDYYGAGFESLLETFIPAAVRKGMGQKLEKQVVINSPFSVEDFDQLNKRARKQAITYQFLRDQIKPLKKSLVVKRLKISPTVIDGLIEKGLVKEVSEVIERTVYEDDLGGEEMVGDQVFELTEEQSCCVASIEKSISAHKFQVHLLHGVTGSGKTAGNRIGYQGGKNSHFSCPGSRPDPADGGSTSRPVQPFRF